MLRHFLLFPDFQQSLQVFCYVVSILAVDVQILCSAQDDPSAKHHADSSPIDRLDRHILQHQRKLLPFFPIRE